jgi:hypothetical protein
MSKEFVDLNTLQSEVKAGNLDLPDLLLKLDQFINSRPSSFTKLVYENAVLSETHVL